MIDPDKIYVLHCIDVAVYNVEQVPARIVYLRKNDYPDTTYQDTLDEAIVKAIATMKYVTFVGNSTELLDDETKIQKWDLELTQSAQFVSEVRFEYVAPQSTQIPNIWMTQIIYATILADVKFSNVPAMQLLGHIEIEPYDKFDAICNIMASNPVLKLQQHPLVHGIECFYDDHTGNVYIFYADNIHCQFAESIINVQNDSINFISSDTDKEQITQDFRMVNTTYHIHYLRHNCQNKLFTATKQKLMVLLSKDQSPIALGLLKYLRNIMEG